MHDLDNLPVHPTMRHPLTGEPLRALYVDRHGRARFPIMGGAPDDPPGGDGTGSGGDSGQGGAGSGDGANEGGNGASGSGSGSGTQNATDDQGRDLGYPKDTRVAEMTADQQAAYHRHQSQKWEGRFKHLVGDRSFDEAKADLDAYAQIQKDQQTPAEQALTAAREEGKTAGQREERRNTATTLFRGTLEAAGLQGDDLDELVANLNVDNFIDDNGVDTTKLTNFAKRFTTKSDKDERRRDFGGGRRDGQQHGQGRGSRGKAEADRRFGGKQKSTTGAE